MNSTTPRSLNLPLLGAWLASAVITVVGVVLLISSNAAQVAFYVEQTADPAPILTAQAGTTVGGLLIAVGLLGLVIALATQAIIGAADRRHADSVLAFDEFTALDDEDGWTSSTSSAPVACPLQLRPLLLPRPPPLRLLPRLLPSPRPRRSLSPHPSPKRLPSPKPHRSPRPRSRSRDREGPRGPDREVGRLSRPSASSRLGCRCRVPSTDAACSAPARNASGTPAPASVASSTPVMNASPAPFVSRTATGTAATSWRDIRPLASRATAIAPRSPRVHTTSDAPAVDPRLHERQRVGADAVGVHEDHVGGIDERPVVVGTAVVVVDVGPDRAPRRGRERDQPVRDRGEVEHDRGCSGHRRRDGLARRHASRRASRGRARPARRPGSSG